MSWSAARRLLWVGAAVVVAAGLVLVGLLERSSWVDEEVRGMTRTLAVIGPLDSTALSGYRVLADFDCLVFRRGSNPFALEACVDAEGRVVETIDRRSFERRIHSVRAEPEASTLIVDRALVEVLLDRMGAPRSP